MHSIRVKITAVVLCSFLIGILTLCGTAYSLIRRENDQTSIEKMTLITENARETLDFYLESLELSVEMAVSQAEDSLETTDINLVSLSRLPDKTAELDAALGEHCRQAEHAFSRIAGHTNGITSYYFCINADLGSSEHGFFWTRTEQDGFVKQPPLNSADLDMNDMEHNTWYFSPLKAGRAVWVGPYKAKNLGDRWTISYVAPVYVKGFLVGVMGMDILLDTMIAQVASIRVYESGYAMLLDKDGTVMYHPMIELGTQVSSRGLDTRQEVFRRMNSRNELIRFTAGGKERQLSFATLKNNMKVAVVAPVDEINASGRHLLWVLLIITGVILAGITLICLLLMRSVTLPLQKLSEASRKLSSGDYDVQLDYQENDEIGALTDSFREMQGYLKNYISDLNGKVYKDALTGVKNKAAMDVTTSRLNAAVKMGKKDDIPEFAFVVFDCNGLKQINDQYGHACGDVFLQTICGTICRIFARSPVFRMGGDEFAVLLQNQDYENRHSLLKEYDQVASRANANTSDPWKKVDAAKGMAEFNPASDENVEQVLKRADERMYLDKRKEEPDRRG